MRFYMMQPGAELVTDTLQSDQLIHDHTGDLLRVEELTEDVNPSKIFPVRVGRMRPDGDMMPQGQLHRPAHRIRITGMIAAGNIGGTDKWKDRRVTVHPFTHITIQIDTQHTNSFK